MLSPSNVLIGVGFACVHRAHRGRVCVRVFIGVSVCVRVVGAYVILCNSKKSY